MSDQLATAKMPEHFNEGKFPLKKREFGGVQPYIPLGPFNLRIPLIHHEWSWTEMLAAFFLGVACLGAGTATTMTTFGFDNPENIGNDGKQRLFNVADIRRTERYLLLSAVITWRPRRSRMDYPGASAYIKVFGTMGTA